MSEMTARAIVSKHTRHRRRRRTHPPSGGSGRRPRTRGGCARLRERGARPRELSYMQWRRSARAHSLESRLQTTSKLSVGCTTLSRWRGAVGSASCVAECTARARSTHTMRASGANSNRNTCSEPRQRARAMHRNPPARAHLAHRVHKVERGLRELGRPRRAVAVEQRQRAHVWSASAAHVNTYWSVRARTHERIQKRTRHY